MMFRYSFSLNARSVSVCTLPFDDTVSIAFASAASSDASQIMTMSYRRLPGFPSIRKDVRAKCSQKVFARIANR